MLSSRKFPAAKKFMDKKWGYQNFRSKGFYITVPKKFIGQPFSVSLFSGFEKFHDSEGYVTLFVEFFCLTESKKT